MLHQLSRDGWGGGGEEMDSAPIDTSFCTADRYQKLWKSYVKLRHLLANSPKVKQMDKQKLMQREVGKVGVPSSRGVFHDHDPASPQMGAVRPLWVCSLAGNVILGLSLAKAQCR